MLSLILVGAGKGERFGFPKAFLKIEKYPLYFFSLRTFLKFNEIKEIVLVVPAKRRESVHKELKTLGLDNIKVVKGGLTRSESVRNGLRNSRGDRILIHDVSRPFIPENLIKRVIKSKGRLVVPFVKLYDTAFEEDKLLKRQKIKIIQTPQKIERGILLEAFRRSRGKNFPDESTMIKEILNVKPVYVKGSFLNFKLTYPEDIIFLKTIWRGLFKPVIGWGYDLHPLEEGRKLYIGGIHIPFKKGAVGHSDGDVLIHSLVDAILGAIGKGDIGTHFPDSEKKWKDAKSEFFLKRCVEIMEKENVIIGNIDCVIFLERPKIVKHRKKIRAKLAKILKIPEEKISIKAKTSEKMGIIGKEEAIASYSVCLLFQKTLPPFSSILKTMS